jgi:hypothetical protein
MQANMHINKKYVVYMEHFLQEYEQPVMSL